MERPHPLALLKLRERLDDDDATCRLRAACAIFQVEKQPDTRASAVLHEALQWTDEGHRHEAMHNLCGLLERNVEFLALVRQLVASNPDVAGACASCLMDVGPVGIPLLIDLLGAQDRAARQMAAYRLGSFAGRLGAREADVTTALLVLRNDADRFVREHAAIALWQIDPQRFARPGGAPAKKR